MFSLPQNSYARYGLLATATTSLVLSVLYFTGPYIKKLYDNRNDNKSNEQ